ncbi:hypothetical protein AB0912_00180 [Streptomyces sp. NPDC007084]|uniref:hypothetical protein n=1 Tax=Streptomyces sp. NPDC007084 TaxID=3154313 RepID=UPI003452369F
MTWFARILCALYGAVFLWLAFCAVQTWGHVPLWTSITMVAASLAPVDAGLRECSRADEDRRYRALLERAARPADLISPAGTREPISADELIAFDRIMRKEFKHRGGAS